MEMIQLRLLQEIYYGGSVSAAAKALHITPSAASQQLSALQRKAPKPLSILKGRRLILTDYGFQLAEIAAKALSSVELFQQELQNPSITNNAPVTIAAFTSAAESFFPKIAHLDNIHLSDLDVPVPDFVNLTSKFDLVIAQRPTHISPRDPAWINRITLLEEPLDIAMRIDHPLATAETRDYLAGLKDATWIAAHDELPLATAIETLSTIIGSKLIVKHRVNNFHLAAEIISCSDSIGLLPRYVGIPRSFKKEIILKPLASGETRRHIEILYRINSVKNEKIFSIIDLLVTATHNLVNQDFMDLRTPI